MQAFLASVRGVGSACRAAGQAIEGLGSKIEGVTSYKDIMKPSTRVLGHQGKQAQLPPNVFVAPSASVIGDVKVGEGASVWYGAIVRGDVNHITVGKGSSVGECAVVHVAKIAGDAPTRIADGVTIGARATIHACTLEDGAVVGAGATVLDGATVGKNSMLASGALLPGGTKVPALEVWSGVPARFERQVTSDDLLLNQARTEETMLLSQVHMEECAKPYEQIMYEKFDHELLVPPDEDEVAAATDPGQRRDISVTPRNNVLGQSGIPGRIFNSEMNQAWDDLPDTGGKAGNPERKKEA